MLVPRSPTCSPYRQKNQANNQPSNQTNSQLCNQPSSQPANHFVPSVSCRQVLVGFADKLRLMTVLMEDLKVVKEFGIKSCRECNFRWVGCQESCRG